MSRQLSPRGPFAVTILKATVGAPIVVARIEPVHGKNAALDQIDDALRARDSFYFARLTDCHGKIVAEYERDYRVFHPSNRRKRQIRKLAVGTRRAESV